jgi:putative transposase
VKYRFINEHLDTYCVATMCRVLRASRSGFYAWLHQPLSDRAIEDERLLASIRDSYTASSGVYGYLRVFADLREAGETCGRHRVARIMRQHKIKALRGYKAPRHIAGRPSIIAPNHLNRAFTVDRPDQAWVTDITYIRTWQGWLYLAVVVDLYACKVVGWSMKPTLAREIVLDALLMAVLRRNPQQRVLIHSDQGTQFGSDDWRRFCREHSLEPSMSRRGNCWDNAVAESFFSSLKKERIRKRVYKTRDLARADIFDYIEVFYNRTRRRRHIGGGGPEPLSRLQREGAKCLGNGASPAFDAQPIREENGLGRVSDANKAYKNNIWHRFRSFLPRDYSTTLTARHSQRSARPVTTRRCPEKG